MNIVKASEVGGTTGENYSEAVTRFRAEMDKKHSASFHAFRGVDYDSKTDRYVAKFEGGSFSTRKFSAKLNHASAEFFLKNADAQGQWYLTLTDGVVTDVTLFDYNH